MERPVWSKLALFPLALGGNVFGWTADERESFAVLDAYAAAGGNHVDTADSYSAWVPGNSGGESETIIGDWMKARGNRDDILVATKAGRLGELNGENVKRFAEESLRRLRTDRIDLFYMHDDHRDVPLEESLGALDELVRAGKVLALGASNFTPARLAQAREVSAREGFASYVALQPYYNLVERRNAEGIPFEGPLQDLALAEGIDVFPFFGLARGFLAGKYRPGGAEIDSPRAQAAGSYLDTARGPAVLEALDEIAAAHETTVAAAALAWLLAQPGISAPIASARTTEQLAELLPVATLRLDDDEIARLSAASELSEPTELV